MKIKYTLRTAFKSLNANRARSGLTILGIVIGISSIILVVSLGQSAEGVIVGELSNFGADTISLLPGKEPSGPADMAGSLFADSIKEKEIRAISNKQNVPDILDVSPEVIVAGKISYRGETYKPFIMGFDAAFFMDAWDIDLAEGDVYGEAETRSKSRVVVLGAKVKEELFGDEKAVGKSVQIKDHKFRVVGVFAEIGQIVFFNMDELVLLPHTSAQTYLSGTDYYNEVIIRAKSPELVDRVVRDIETTLLELHNIDDPEEADFHMETQEGIVEQVGTIIGIFTLFLAMMVAITLVVGGIGVMNIMLVSVTERTREIGLRKALGATNSDILAQFLIESILLTGAGGIIGVLIGAFLGVVVSLVVVQSGSSDSWLFIFPVKGAILGIFSASVIGLVFGLYPARKAAKKDPIEALRYE